MTAEGILLPRIVAALDAAAWERVSVAPDRFVRIAGTAPAWLEAIAPSLVHDDAPVDLAETFPVLDTFLGEADDLWRHHRGIRIASDYWTDCAPDGEEIHLEAIALDLAHAPDILVITRDERTFVQQQLLLQRARDLLLAHDALTVESERKDVLVHCIVHDLANPLGSVLGALSVLLARNELADTDREMLEVAFTAAQRQRGLIREILDVFAAEAGRDAGHPALGDIVPDLWQEISAAVAGSTLDARARSIRVVRELIAEREVIPVIADRSRLARVLGNLLDNALKWTPPEHTVRVRCVDEGAMVRVEIEDEGPGVAREVVPRLFRRFARGPHGEGTGLGLYFCRITVERWGGSIGYEPRRDGPGARFWFRVRKATAVGG